MTFLVQHWLGNMGMPRRYPDYLPSDGFTTLNTTSTIGSFVLGASLLPFIWNIFRSLRYGEVLTADDPWGYVNSLEWATSFPATAAQLHLPAPDPLRTARLRTAPPPHDQTDARRSPPDRHWRALSLLEANAQVGPRDDAGADQARVSRQRVVVLAGGCATSGSGAHRWATSAIGTAGTHLATITSPKTKYRSGAVARMLKLVIKQQ